MPPMDKKITSLFVIALAAVIGLVVFVRQPHQTLSILWSRWYYLLILAALVIALAMMFLKKEYIKYLKPWYYLLFFPVVLFPLFRCYFSVPYLFCNACPRKCPWGEVRRFLIPAAILINLDRRTWCYCYCPLGKVQDAQCALSPKKFCLPKWASVTRYAILFLIPIPLIMSFVKKSGTVGMLNQSYHYGWISIAVLSTIFLAAFFIPRFWCNYICPVGTIGDLGLACEKKVKKK